MELPADDEDVGNKLPGAEFSEFWETYFFKYSFNDCEKSYLIMLVVVLDLKI